MEFSELPEFSHELKRLNKRYPSLCGDVDRLKQTLSKLQLRNTGKYWNCLHQSEKLCIYKIRLACRYLRSTSMRIVYAHHIEKNRIVFMEIYFKGDRENENAGRIKEYLKKFRGISDSKT